MSKKDHEEQPTDSCLSNSNKTQPESLVEFFRQSPLMGVELDLECDKSPGRDIDLGFDP
jgi:hypothetical protein